MQQVVQAVQIGHIRFNEDGAVAFAEFAQVFGGRFTYRFVQVGYDDVGALLDQAAGDSFSEALCSSRNDDRFVLNTTRSSTGTRVPDSTPRECSPTAPALRRDPSLRYRAYARLLSMRPRSTSELLRTL